RPTWYRPSAFQHDGQLRRTRPRPIDHFIPTPSAAERAEVRATAVDAKGSRVAYWTDVRPDRPRQQAPEESSMLTTEKMADYVERWVAAFESKDLDRVLAFYTNDVV